MKNKDKYKTAKDQAQAFNRFCHKQQECATCPIKCDRFDYTCQFYWLERESEGEVDDGKMNTEKAPTNESAVGLAFDRMMGNPQDAINKLCDEIQELCNKWRVNGKGEVTK